MYFLEYIGLFGNAGSCLYILRRRESSIYIIPHAGSYEVRFLSVLAARLSILYEIDFSAI
jgi:hypothetical protein